MKKILLLCVAAITVVQLGMAQSNDESARVVRQFKVTPLAPGFEAELPLARTATFVIRPAAGCNFQYDSDDGFISVANVYVDFQCRFYYNLDKKFAQNGVNNNSGSFFALSCIMMKEFYTNSDEYALSNVLAIGPVWGMQWTTRRNIYWRFNGGLSYGFASEGGSAIIPTTEFCVGYVF